MARRQATIIDTLQTAQLARDVEMAEHLNRHVCTPKPAHPTATVADGAA